MQRKSNSPGPRRRIIVLKGHAIEREPLARKILISIVDDDESVREAMARLMSSLGYRVQTFDSGMSLLSSAHRARTDCLIADVQMPGMTGLELHLKLRSEGQQIPTILITGHHDERVRARALEAGVLFYLTKPFSEDDILNCIRFAVA
jgi:FixJ family two-component response regulator